VAWLNTCPFSVARSMTCLGVGAWRTCSFSFESDFTAETKASRADSDTEFECKLSKFNEYVGEIATD